jgi:glycine/D-amino acid oxidase-like deaminating enzyme
LKEGFHRIPGLRAAGFSRFVNGPESFTPDNNFLLGETAELRGLFVAAGFNSAGIACAGGAGKALAEWIIGGAMPYDLTGFATASRSRSGSTTRWHGPTASR